MYWNSFIHYLDWNKRTYGSHYLFLSFSYDCEAVQSLECQSGIQTSYKSHTEVHKEIRACANKTPKVWDKHQSQAPDWSKFKIQAHNWLIWKMIVKFLSYWPTVCLKFKIWPIRFLSPMFNSESRIFVNTIPCK